MSDKPTTMLYSAAAQQQRSLRWMAHKDEIRRSKTREKKAKERRNKKLVGAREKCAAERKAVTAGCKLRRDNIRAEAHQAIAKEKKERDTAREAYRYRAGIKSRPPGVKKAKRMSRAENDSLAEHNIDPGLVGVWRQVKKQFPYHLAPDHRAELFGEWVEENQERVAEMKAEQFEGIDWGKLEREAYEEAVPF